MLTYIKSEVEDSGWPVQYLVYLIHNPIILRSVSAWWMSLTLCENNILLWSMLTPLWSFLMVVFVQLECQCQELHSEQHVTKVENVKLKQTNDELTRELDHTNQELVLAQEQLNLLQEQSCRLHEEKEMWVIAWSLSFFFLMTSNLPFLTPHFFFHDQNLITKFLMSRTGRRVCSMYIERQENKSAVVHTHTLFINFLPNHVSLYCQQTTAKILFCIFC